MPLSVKGISSGDLWREGRCLQDEMEEFTKSAQELWLATAFVDGPAVDTVLRVARVKIRFLTGTFGSATRKATFRKLLHLSRTCPRLQVRLWNCAGHKQFHGKLYLWRSGSQGIAWIGSPNFTSGRQPSAPGGLARAGEVVLELRDAWSGNVLKEIRDLFCREWARGKCLTERMVEEYREASRDKLPPDIRDKLPPDMSPMVPPVKIVPPVHIKTDSGRRKIDRKAEVKDHDPHPEYIGCYVTWPKRHKRRLRPAVIWTVDSIVKAWNGKIMWVRFKECSHERHDLRQRRHIGQDAGCTACGKAVKLKLAERGSAASP